ncbi:MFS transporter [Streptomyces sp. NPDC048639]|uniref:MDR family MFS transporter n=1 Tax=Streptomyces sp. NPDC048639 TaxID=3365581 RepID=UPI00371A098C
MTSAFARFSHRLRRSRQKPEGAPSLRWVLVGMMLVSFMGALDTTILATALPTIAGDLGDLKHLSWPVTSYLLAVMASAMVWGKLGDLLGRKRVLTAAIALFLVGSLLCGQSESMAEFVVFRGLQGLGGGGVMVLPQAILADIVGPRDRGRYQVYFAASIVLAGIIGPLAGGVLVDGASWRWAFYLNLPIGIFALLVIVLRLRIATPREPPDIDGWGIALVATFSVALVLIITWGGVVFPWLSLPVVGLIALCLVLLPVIRRIEKRAGSPVLPLHVLRRRGFIVPGSISFFFFWIQVGLINYIPIYFQLVKGTSAPVSGLHLLPMTCAALVCYTLSGRAISRWGRYKVFPVTGAVFLTAGVTLCSFLDSRTTSLVACLYLVVLGLGFGMISQVALVAAQNSAPYRDLGAVTSGIGYLRNVGAAFGLALFGAILNRVLSSRLSAAAAEGRFPGGNEKRWTDGNPKLLHELTGSARTVYIDAYVDAVHTIFLSAIPVALCILVLALMMREVPLRRTAGGIRMRDGSIVLPASQESREEMQRLLEVIAGLQTGEDLHRHLAERVGARISSMESWTLFRVVQYGPATTEHLARSTRIAGAELREKIDTLRGRGLVEEDRGGVVSLTAAGDEFSQDMIRAQTEDLVELVADWSPEGDAELRGLLQSHARELLVDERKPPLPSGGSSS